ncbi:LPS export ABC transporter periplasmic protein LptC [Hydrogenimonas sp.]
MGLNIRHFIALLGFGALAAIFFLEPYHTVIVEKKGIPQVAFFDFSAYEITDKGVTDILRAKAARKFGPKMVVDAPDLRRLAPEGEERVRARRAVFTEGEGIELKRDVVLRRSDGWRMQTPYLRYLEKKSLYTTLNEPFTITFGQSVVRGRALRYDQKRGKILARAIRAKISEKDTKR